MSKSTKRKEEKGGLEATTLKLLNMLKAQNQDNDALMRRIVHLAGKHRLSALPTAEQIGFALEVATEENRGLTELLVRYFETMPNSEGGTSEEYAAAVGMLLYQNQQRLDGRVQEAGQALYRTFRQQIRPDGQTTPPDPQQ